MLDRVSIFADLFADDPDAADFAPLRRCELIGRPLGSAAFVAEIETRLGRRLASGKRGRKPKAEWPIPNAKGASWNILHSTSRVWAAWGITHCGV